MRGEEPPTNRLAFCADLTLLLDGLERPGCPLNRNDSPQDAQEAQGVQLPRFDENPVGRNSPTCPEPGRQISKENLAAREHHATIGLNGSTGVPSLHDRIGTELPRFLASGEAPFATWHNGAYVLGSFPCALWCFLASREDCEQTLFTAVDAGHDADTVAAMACTLSGRTTVTPASRNDSSPTWSTTLGCWSWQTTCTLSTGGSMDLRDRYRGALLGLTVGDALGTTMEFKRPGTYQPLTAIVGGKTA